MRRAAVLAALAAAIAVAAVIWVAGGRRAPAAAAPQRPRYRESPVLRERVERGELPPVEQRLPDEPLVIEPVEGTGRYDSDPAPRP